MQYRKLGHSGLEVSLVGVGCNTFGVDTDAAEVDAIVGTAFDTGVTLFDTAESYADGASERMLGQALRARDRDGVIVATKFNPSQRRIIDGAAMLPSTSRRYVRYAVERSLERLQTDHIDLYQTHSPDPTTPIEETLEVLTDLVRDGKIRYFGVSNFAGWQLADAVWTAEHHHLARPVSLQNRWNLLEREIERELVPACARFGVGILPYFPLAAGLLAGRYRTGRAVPEGSHFERLLRGGHAGRLGEPETLARVDRLTDFAEARGHTVLELAMSWLAAQPAVGSVIAGARTAAQLRSNVTCADWALGTDDLRAIDELLAAP